MAERLTDDQFEMRLVRLLALHTAPVVRPINPAVVAHRAAASDLPRRGLVVRFPRLSAVGWAWVAILLALSVGLGSFAGAQLLHRSEGLPIGPTASPTALSELKSITSSFYSYSVDIPTSWYFVAATSRWPGGQLEKWYWADRFWMRAQSRDVPGAWIAGQPVATTSPSQWFDDWARTRGTPPEHCVGSASPWVDATFAGIPARRLSWRCANAQDARWNYDEYTFLVAGMGYVVSGEPSMTDVLAQSLVVTQ